MTTTEEGGGAGSVLDQPPPFRQSPAGRCAVPPSEGSAVGECLICLDLTTDAAPNVEADVDHPTGEVRRHGGRDQN